MYGFNNYVGSTPEQLILQVNQKEVFELIFEYKLDLNIKHISPFREDKTPGCFFEYREDGTLTLVDFGEIKGKTHRSCISAIAEKFNFTIQNSIQYISNNFIINNNVQVLPNYVKNTHTSSDLSYTIKEFTNKDVLYWSKYLITVKDLIKDNIYSVKSFISKSKKGVYRFTPLQHCYAIDFLDAVKIYQPYKKDKGKWITTCNENHIGNIDNLPQRGDKLVITKSYKDHRVLRNLGLSLNVIWFQNEGCVPDEDILRNLLSRFNKIVILYDNDRSGIQAATKIKMILNTIKLDSTISIILPKKRLHKQLYGDYLKDPAEFINKEGKQYLIKILKQIGI